MRWTNWHRHRLGQQDELRFKEEHYMALATAIMEKKLEQPADHETWPDIRDVGTSPVQERHTQHAVMPILRPKCR